MSAVLLAFLFLIPGRSGAEGLIEESPTSAGDNLVYLFPNWCMATAAKFNIETCPDVKCAWCPNGYITGLTIYNYGTAAGVADISAVYFNITCGKTTVTNTMTFAGDWTVGVGGDTHPAWTWAGSIAWNPSNLCFNNSLLTVYVDIASCPTVGASVIMGLGYNDLDPVYDGGMSDDCGYFIPSWDEARTGGTKYIQYGFITADKDFVVPGDTISYTIFYGRPGAAAITNVVVTDTMPPDSHYVPGSGSPAPDPGWNPEPGPPPRLRWNLPGFASTAGGATSELRFSVTVDWGNGEAFEPGSGDSGAQEGFRFENVAAEEFLDSGCSPSTSVVPPVDAVVRRYLMWKVADQDLLFAPRVGYPEDEITYSIFLRNESSTRTWWKVRIWDTVPAELTTWGADSGFWDPCLGWTMTPAGCAASSPGWKADASRTLLTWTLDLPPSATRTVEWKARMKVAGVNPGATAISKASVMALGDPGKVGGSGNARAPRTFTHLAIIVLRTTYFSYVGQTCGTRCWDIGLFINFWPLNKAAAFELRKLEYYGAGFALNGGKSASIGAFQGTCSGGFVDGGYGGCGAERAPAQYFWPFGVQDVRTLLYKVTANAPVLWMGMPDTTMGDAATYIPSTSLHHSGFVHYSFRREHGSGSSLPGYGESWVVINTSVDVDGNYDPGLATTAHLFKWDFVTSTWQYVKGGDIDKNSLWMPFAGCTPADRGHYKIISSDARLLVYQGFGTFGDPADLPDSYDNHGTLAPNAENGLMVSAPGGPGTFYPISAHNRANWMSQMLVGNTSMAAQVTYRIYNYRPKNPALASAGIPPTLCGNSGYWDLKGTRTADPGLGAADNPHCWGNGYPDQITNGTGTTANAWKFAWQSGGSMTVGCGKDMFNEWSGASMLHTTDGRPAGQEFWMFYCGAVGNWAVLLFCPSSGMAVNAVTGSGFSATYTTDGPDQCIAFTQMSNPCASCRQAYRFQLLPGGKQGEMVAMYHQSAWQEKFYTAPFVNTGVHYDIIAPPIVFSGQPFWITVVVLMGSGTTQVDYAGTTSFTSTDPTTQMAGVGMDGYNYTWVPASDQGVHRFFNVVYDKLGLQTLVASDIFDGSVSGLASLMVVGVDVKLEKQPRLSVAASGDTVQFRICWSNYSSASAFTFVITDAVPMGTTYVPEVPSAMACGSTDGVAITVGHSSDTTTPATNWTTASGMLPTGVRWLRWTVPIVGVQTTGCACFKVSVN